MRRALTIVAAVALAALVGGAALAQTGQFCPAARQL